MTSTGFTEKSLFKKLKDYFPDLEKAEGTFDSFDCYTETHKTIIELKCRGSHYPELLIEKVKWDKLAQIRASQGLGTLYICSTPIGVWAWNLEAINEPEWSEKRLPKSTEFGSVEWITKIVGYLHIDKAQPIQFE